MVKGNYEIIKLSHLFDENWYSKKYLNDKPSDPIKHYIEVGYKENYNPSPIFDTAWYLKEYPDIKKSGINPFVHYIKNGQKEGRKPKWDK